jgi:hypothetical protein
MASHAMQRETRRIKRQPLWRTWLPGAGAREVLALLDLVEGAGWGDGRYRAVLFRNLCDFGYERLVVRHWKKMRPLVEADVASWSEVGRALLDLDRKQEARRLLARWRQRAGVRMWMVANYVMCFPRHGQNHWQEVRSACEDALARLPQDHRAKFLVHVQAEMCALLDDTEAFGETWVKRRGYFNGKLDESEWFESRRNHLLGDIPLMADLLEQNQTELFRKAYRDLRKKHGPSLQLSAGGVGTETRMPWWLWWLLLWTAIRALESLFYQAAHP